MDSPMNLFTRWDWLGLAFLSTRHGTIRGGDPYQSSDQAHHARHHVDTAKPSDGLGRMVYGLGWQGGTLEGLRDVGHGGTQQGTSTMMLIAPDARAGVVVLIPMPLARPNWLHNSSSLAPAEKESTPV